MRATVAPSDPRPVDEAVLEQQFYTDAEHQKFIQWCSDFSSAPSLIRQGELYKRLLERWLEKGAAMGGGPRAQLTQDTLDAIAGSTGLPLTNESRDGLPEVDREFPLGKKVNRGY